MKTPARPIVGYSARKMGRRNTIATCIGSAGVLTLLYDLLYAPLLNWLCVVLCYMYFLLMYLTIMY